MLFPVRKGIFFLLISKIILDFYSSGMSFKSINLGLFHLSFSKYGASLRAERVIRHLKRPPGRPALNAKP